MKQRAIKSLMFHANDADNHDVTWSPNGNAWMMENNAGSIAFYASLTFALERMSKVTGVKENNFTVSHNPYTHTR